MRSSCLLLTNPVAQMVKNLPAKAGDQSLILGSVRFPWRRAWQPTPGFLPGEFMDRGNWWATVHGVTNSWTQLSD